MDTIRKHEVETARCTTESERLTLAVHLMAAGIELKRDALRNRYRGETEEQVQARLRRWLIEKDDQQR